jgi:hypothetical protein
MPRDQNGNELSRDIRKVTEGGTIGYAATVWSGGAYGPATDVRRYVYKTREQADLADIAHTGHEGSGLISAYGHKWHDA